MLDRIFSKEEYIDWTKEYWELGDRLTIYEVKKVFDHEAITCDMVKKLNLVTF